MTIFIAMTIVVLLTASPLIILLCMLSDNWDYDYESLDLETIDFDTIRNRMEEHIRVLEDCELKQSEN